MNFKSTALFSFLGLLLGLSLFSRWVGIQSEWLLVFAIAVSVLLVVFIWIVVCTDQPNPGYEISLEMKSLFIKDTFRQTLVLTHFGKSVGISVLNQCQLLLYDVSIFGVKEILKDIDEVTDVQMDAGKLHVSRLEDDSGFRIFWTTDEPWLLKKE